MVDMLDALLMDRRTLSFQACTRLCSCLSLLSASTAREALCV